MIPKKGQQFRTSRRALRSSGGGTVQPHPARRHVLVCVAGTTPQIVTETLYALMVAQHDPVDEVRVVTTLQGRDRIKRALIDEGRLEALVRDYNLPPVMFDETRISLLPSGDGRTADDIRTVEDNRAAADTICRIVRELALDPNVRLHASIAGRRKTMGVYLVAAMQLYGRKDDRISHVLVSPPEIESSDFYYPAPGSTAAEVHLADIPFVRLRGIAGLREDLGDFGELVTRTQDGVDLLDAEYQVRLDCRHLRLCVGGRCAQLTPRDFLLFLAFAELYREGVPAGDVVKAGDIRRKHVERAFRNLTRARGHERPAADFKLEGGFEFIPGMLKEVANPTEDRRKSFRDSVTQAMSRIKKACDAAGIPDRYRIQSRVGGKQGAYALDIPVERLVCE